MEAWGKFDESSGQASTVSNIIAPTLPHALKHCSCDPVLRARFVLGRRGERLL